MYGLVLQGVLALLAFQAVRKVKHRRLCKRLCQCERCVRYVTLLLLQSSISVAFLKILNIEVLVAPS